MPSENSQPPNGLRSKPNDVRDLRKWYAQPTK
jgi:hypothetical protein